MSHTPAEWPWSSFDQGNRTKKELSMCGLPEEVIAAGEALKQKAQHIANGSNSGLGQGHVSKSQQQSWDELEFPH